MGVLFSHSAAFPRITGGYSLWHKAFLLALPGLLAAACSHTEVQEEGGIERLHAPVVEVLDFNEDSFTQGLEISSDGQLLVGTGQYGQSRLYKVDPLTGEESVSAALESQYFGEGITQYGNSIWQLTWKAGKALRYDASSLQRIGQASYPGEGWGLCALDSALPGASDFLVMSDGSSFLRIVDPDSFAEISRFEVTVDGQALEKINELECVPAHESVSGKDEIYANVWFSTDIVRIDPSTGAVTAIIDTSEVVNNSAPESNNVLNGIAHIPGTDEFYVTGKRWPDLYRVKFK